MRRNEQIADDTAVVGQRRELIILFSADIAVQWFEFFIEEKELWLFLANKHDLLQFFRPL